MIYKKTNLESRLLSIVGNISSAKKELLREISELNSNCTANHDPFFVDNLEKFGYNIKNGLDATTKYKIEEVTENLEFIYKIKELKQGYKFGNLPEKAEEENIIGLYKVISDNCEKLDNKQISLAADLVHYLNTSDKWEKVNYFHFLNHN
ncbi:MAG: hypothetical protein M1322_02070 [Candidatus Parvarchaeota archaeon]|jgi:hypothetical protein|nr:hypothetical protein [Candidatus Parvarchaeota archaeon]